MKEDRVFTATDGETIAATVYRAARENAPGIIYVHGFKGFKDWGFVPYIGRFLSERGFTVVTFNFSHNGIGAEPTEFTESDRFAANTFSREIRELSEIIDAAGRGEFGPMGKLGLLGHSRGGGIALLTAVEHDRIDAVVTWSSVASFERYSDEVKAAWRKRGYHEVVNQRTGQIMRLNTTLLEDMERFGATRLDIEAATARLRRPLLIIHGQDDDGVPVSEAERLFTAADIERTRLVKIPGTGHTFDAKHPFEGAGEKLDYILAQSAEFYEERLGI